MGCNDDKTQYTEGTGKKFRTRVYEHQLVTKRHDPLSLISAHGDLEGHKLNFQNLKIDTQGRTKHSWQLLKA